LLILCTMCVNLAVELNERINLISTLSSYQSRTIIECIDLIILERKDGPQWVGAKN